MEHNQTSLGTLLRAKLDNPQGFRVVPPSGDWQIVDNTGHRYPMPKKHHISAVRAMAGSNNPHVCGMVQAIKFMRAEYGLGLKEARDLCDWIAQYHDWQPSDPFANAPR